jgi:hypothetical protein
MRLRSFLNAVARPSLLLLLPMSAIALGEAQVIKAAWADYLRRSAGYMDVPAQVEQKLAPLRDVLPKYGRIGYIDPDHSWQNADATRAFYLSQYVLAPRVIVNTTELEYTIYSSHLGRALTAEVLPAGTRVLSQFRPELAVLFRSPQ